MNGPAVFTFTLSRVPGLVEQMLGRAGSSRTDVDWFVFHQANKYMLDALRTRCKPGRRPVRRGYGRNR